MITYAAETRPRVANCDSSSRQSVSGKYVGKLIEKIRRLPQRSGDTITQCFDKSDRTMQIMRQEEWNKIESERGGGGGEERKRGKERDLSIVQSN